MHVVDFLSIVVGGYGAVADVARWGYHRFDRGRFVRLPAAEVASVVSWVDLPIPVRHCDATTCEQLG